MARLLIAVALGIVLAVGATIAAASALTGVANGSPTSGSLYQYGNRG
jgi:hypothetical protein